MKEIVIIGGGLAGLSLGSALRLKGVPVTIVEAGDYPRHRVCGEFISGTTAGTLSTLGIANLLDDARSHTTLGWFLLGKRFHENQMPEPAMGISRYLLDERLRVHFQGLGGALKTNSRARPVFSEGTISATGKKTAGGEWIGLKVHAKGIPQHTDLEMHLGSNGYAGLAGIEDGWTNLCALFRMNRAIRGSGADLLASYLEAGGNHALAENLRGATIREDSFQATAGFKMGAQPQVPGMLRLGDSDRLIPPFTGNGMSMAFQAAELAVAPLTSWAINESSWICTANRVRELSAKKFRCRMMVAGLLHPVILSSAGRALLQQLGTSGMLPFTTVLQLIR